MQRLADEPGLGISGLASRQRLAVNTVSNLVQHLVVSGLVERLTRPGDRRSVSLNLTDEGTSVLNAWQEANDRRIGQALQRLPEDSQRAIENAVPALAALATLLESDDQAQGERTDAGRAP
ncbi:MarR family winged helix-turn-helix transcriptional regulator [Arthrobacter sp. KBS0702]|uniref:MarR family winged helix-turn-helix transcriptional regulator n=1 Tax=Arthrobacter sp. KBS0702 TaxID=2578107 RepID=UPI0021BD44AD|nr:MarR family transcriptional regulator [Arthrobacter sp. KBS0702]